MGFASRGGESAIRAILSATPPRRGSRTRAAAMTSGDAALLLPWEAVHGLLEYASKNHRTIHSQRCPHTSRPHLPEYRDRI